MIQQWLGKKSLVAETSETHALEDAALLSFGAGLISATGLRSAHVAPFAATQGNIRHRKATSRLAMSRSKIQSCRSCRFLSKFQSSRNRQNMIELRYNVYNIYHYISLYIIIYHYISLFISLYIIIYIIIYIYIIIIYISLYIIIYHYITLYIIIYHYISLYIITYHYISLYIIIYHYISLCIIIYHYISLYIIMYHYISLYIIIYHYTYIYICHYIYIIVIECIQIIYMCPFLIQLNFMNLISFLQTQFALFHSICCICFFVNCRDNPQQLACFGTSSIALVIIHNI